MLLTVSKRLEFSASRRLFVESWSAEQNRAVFGPETFARYGTGRNYVAFFVFSGNVNSKTGMLVNISEIKKRVGAVLHAKFDHKFLTKIIPRFPCFLRRQKISRGNSFRKLRICLPDRKQDSSLVISVNRPTGVQPRTATESQKQIIGSSSPPRARPCRQI